MCTALSLPPVTRPLFCAFVLLRLRRLEGPLLTDVTSYICLFGAPLAGRCGANVHSAFSTRRSLSTTVREQCRDTSRYPWVLLHPELRQKYPKELEGTIPRNRRSVRIKRALCWTKRLLQCKSLVSASTTMPRISLISLTHGPLKMTFSYRHAAPSGPWPWMDFDEDIPAVDPNNQLTGSDKQPWHGYPQSSFPNWTESQVRRCEMLTACPDGESKVFKVDVLHDGTFDERGSKLATIKGRPSETEFWDLLHRPVSPPSYVG